MRISYNFIDQFLDFIFRDSSRKYILIAFVLGLILRIIAASNVAPLADEMLHGPHAMNIIQSGVINLQNQSPAWFYLTDIAYILFGVDAIGARFLSIIFGAFAILLTFLIGKELFGEKIGIIASVLLAFSAYTLRYTLMEMDIAMIFFILMANYYFLKDMRTGKLTVYPAIFMGVAILIKAIALPFLASFIVYFFFAGNSKEEKLSFLKKNRKGILVSAIIVFLLILPVIAYNVILYNQKGITDVLFSRFLKVNQEIYSSLQGFDKSFSFSYLITEGLSWTPKTFLKLDPILFILGVLGFFAIFMGTNRNAKAFCVYHILPLVFLMGTSLLQTHFVSFMPLLCLSGAFFINDTFSKFKWDKKYISYLIILIIIVNLIIVAPNLTSKSAIFKMRSYAQENIAQNDIVVVDGRIYGGRIAWMFNDKNYIQANYLEELIALNTNLSGQRIPAQIHFIECTKQDCGWGTIHQQQDFNRSMVGLFSAIKNSSDKVKVFNGGGGYDEVKGEPYFTVYKSTVMIAPALYSAIKSTHVWFYYPVRWELNDWYDKYDPHPGWQTILNLLGKLFLWVAVIIAILSPLILLRELIKP